ncbi:MAG: hypothetical protein HC923_10315 [Myxococcales bacterium]|nr:hypothetical protein [Myxococcales bacterium]
MGVVHAPFTDKSYDITASQSGMIIGLAQPQLVLPGFAAFHVGFSPEQPVPEDQTEDPAVEHAEQEVFE